MLLMIFLGLVDRLIIALNEKKLDLADSFFQVIIRPFLRSCLANSQKGQ